MTSEPMRDPLTDPLLTPANSALVVIDYQPSQIQTVTSMDTELLVRNIVSVARTAKSYGLPIVLSTVNVANGQGHTIPSLQRSSPNKSRSTGRRSMPGKMSSSARQSKRAGRNKLIMTALWTEVVFRSRLLTLYGMAMRSTPSSTPWEGLLERRIEPVLSASSKAGAQPISWVSLACELQRIRLWACLENLVRT